MIPALVSTVVRVEEYIDHQANDFTWSKVVVKVSLAALLKRRMRSPRCPYRCS